MNPESPSEQYFGVAFLRVASVVLFGIFLIAVLLSSLPWQILDPLWQLRLITSLVDMGGYPLLGVVVLNLTHLLEPSHRPLGLQLMRVCRWSRLAALGYLLMVPLLLSALWRDHGRIEQLGQRQRQALLQEHAQLQRAIRGASNETELLRSIQRFQAPAVAEFAQSTAPLAMQRRQALELLEATTTRAKANMATLPKGSLTSIVINNLRLALLALLLAFGYSSAYTGRASFPLLGSVLTMLLLLLPGSGQRHRQAESPLDAEHQLYESLSEDDASA